MIENNELLVPKLMSVKGLKNYSDINLFETFVMKTELSLKCLKIGFNYQITKITFKLCLKFCEFSGFAFECEL